MFFCQFFLLFLLSAQRESRSLLFSFVLLACKARFSASKSQVNALTFKSFTTDHVARVRLFYKSCVLSTLRSVSLEIKAIRYDKQVLHSLAAVNRALYFHLDRKSFDGTRVRVLAVRPTKIIGCATGHFSFYFFRSEFTFHALAIHVEKEKQQYSFVSFTV